MAGIFKKIRRRLLTQNRFTRYLFYAIGEIILVVIGILVAVQVNEMRGESQQRKKETYYLRSLKTDLDSSFLELERVRKKSERISKTSKAVVNIINGTSPVPDDSLLIEAVNNLMGYTHARFTDGTIEEIINTGNLELIRNDTIRRFVVAWHDNIEFIREFETLTKAHFLEIEDYLHDYLSLPGMFVEGEQAEYSFNRMLNEPRFGNLVFSGFSKSSSLNFAYGEYEKAFRVYYESINREIKAHEDQSDPGLFSQLFSL